MNFPIIVLTRILEFSMCKIVQGKLLCSIIVLQPPPTCVLIGSFLKYNCMNYIRIIELVTPFYGINCHVPDSVVSHPEPFGGRWYIIILMVMMMMNCH